MPESEEPDGQQEDSGLELGSLGNNNEPSEQVGSEGTPTGEHSYASRQFLTLLGGDTTASPSQHYTSNRPKELAKSCSFSHSATLHADKAHASHGVRLGALCVDLRWAHAPQTGREGGCQ